MILECVPNISEGIELDVVSQISSAIKNIKVRNIHSDPDHNRSVLTFFGTPEEAVEAAFQMTLRSMQLLDINSHQGGHPFIGVVDVIPFIPFKDATMEDAKTAAHKLGEKLWKELKLPIYYYGEAAKIKERKDLPYVRKGGYAVLREEISRPERKPDVGEGLHVTAGATAIGAREFLIAYNINLNTNDLSIAQSIAKNIRESHGGLKGVRALGLPLDSRGITQVSMNIVDHKETSLEEVYESVDGWAREYKVEIIGSELVGMMPKGAYSRGIEKKLKITNFILELLI
ncbi:glutamate formimidoyltransferase [Candidatus Saganbacteria bacterium]|nr:glutamate formimidoyltransferase [Candidatus Saganbacteria bacterium]